jgi:hypothetical protein
MTVAVKLRRFAARRWLVLRHEVVLERAPLIGQRYTTGSSAPQLPCRGGVSGVNHSSVVARHGLGPACLPFFRLQIRLNRNRSCTAATKNAAVLIASFIVCTESGMKYVSPSA